MGKCLPGEPMQKRKLPNWQIAVYAVHVLGGGSKPVPTEDVALKCYEMAPDSFSWVRYPQHPDKDIARSALVDARKPKNGGLVDGRAGKGRGHYQQQRAAPASDGWFLTKAGARWIMQNQARLASELKHREPSSHRQDRLRELARIKAHSLFERYSSQPEGFAPSLGDMAELFRCRVDATTQTWEKRFRAARTLAELADDHVVAAFLDNCEASVASQFDNI